MKGRLGVGTSTCILVGAAAVVLMLGPRLVQQETAHTPAGAAQSVLKDVAGPETPSVVPPEQRASHGTYDHGAANRLAVLLTEPDSSWLGVAHGLKAIGIPFRITTDYKEAVRHHVVLVYPMISGRMLSHDALAALAAVPRRGGTLIGVNVPGGALNEVFGVGDAVPSKTRFAIRFTNEAAWLAPPIAGNSLIRLGGTAQTGAALGTYGYTNPHALPLAAYEDGSVAITDLPIGQGHAFAFGFDLGNYMLRGHNNRAGGADVSRYEAGTDTVLRLLREIYRRGEPGAITLGTVPAGRALSILLTHDVDYSKSVGNSLAYAAYERSRGIRATYFIQTKYVRDYNDTAFFDDHGVALLKQLAAMGMELASHTVAHSRAFLEFPMGTGEEAFPSYRPFVRDAQRTDGGTILGELRVSKFLLETVVTHEAVVSFRPGDLAIPAALPQALAAAGYRFSSAATASDAQTHLPFQLTYGWGISSDTPIFEFPITVEDERGPLPLARLDLVIDLATQLSTYGGSFVVLIHPNVLHDKVEFERRLVEAMRDQAWFGSISDFGKWWAARNATEIDVAEVGANPTVHVHAPDPIDGLTLLVPAGWGFSASDPGNASVKVAKGTVVLGPVAGDVALHFHQSSCGPTGTCR